MFIIGTSTHLNMTCYRIQYEEENQGAPLSKPPFIHVVVSPFCHFINFFGIVNLPQRDHTGIKKKSQFLLLGFH